jgi:lysylphosphatidylglycerol synthetase-like protein (DUF2156 family)
MPLITFVIGAVLVILGVGMYLATGQPSVTALIPAFVGGLLLILGAVAQFASSAVRKHVMHTAVLIGLIGALGGLYPVFKNSFDVSKPAVQSGLGMTGLCAIFVGLCVRSFIQARKAQRAAAAETASVS